MRVPQRVERRLRRERVIWLTTVSPAGVPQPSPVWFVWDGEEFLVYSQPAKPKLRNIGRNPRVALHLNSDEVGSEVVAFSGRARIDRRAPKANKVRAYARKYATSIADLGTDPEGFARDYSVAIRVKPDSLRSW